MISDKTGMHGRSCEVMELEQLSCQPDEDNCPQVGNSCSPILYFYDFLVAKKLNNSEGTVRFETFLCFSPDFTFKKFKASK